MTAALVTYVVLTVMLGTLLVVFIPTLGHQGLGNRSRAVRRDGDRRGSIVDKIAGAVVMFLGRLTIAILHLFETLGVDMSAFDEALARLTAFTSAQASTLREANESIATLHAQIDSLVANDAAQDQIDIAIAVKAALDEAAAKIDEVTNNLENPPAEPDLPEVPVEPTPEPEEPVVVDPAPVEPTPEPPVIVEPVPVDPGAEPVPVETLPEGTPVVEAPNGPVTEVPAEAEVVPAETLPEGTPVVEVTEGSSTAGQ